MKKLVDVIPQVEAELNRLNRDYDVVKARYSQMLQRWEDLQTGKRVKTGTDQVQFRIINPPFAPIDPDGPPRASISWPPLSSRWARGSGSHSC